MTVRCQADDRQVTDRWQMGDRPVTERWQAGDRQVTDGCQAGEGPLWFHPGFSSNTVINDSPLLCLPAEEEQGTHDEARSIKKPAFSVLFVFWCWRIYLFLCVLLFLTFWWFCLVLWVYFVFWVFFFFTFWCFCAFVSFGLFSFESYVNHVKEHGTLIWAQSELYKSW